MTKEIVKIFESKNIKLRKLAADDYTLYHSWRNDVEVMQATSPYLDLYTIEDTQQFIALISSQSSAKGYLIEHKESERTVGIISLVNIDSLIEK